MINIQRELQNIIIYSAPHFRHPVKYEVHEKYEMAHSVLMTVLFLWELQIQGLVSRTLQYKQLCWTTWKECTSYVNHRKVYLYLGWLWYLTFLIGFRVLASQTPYSPLPPSQPCTGAPTSSPCPRAVAASGVHVGTDHPRSLHRSTAAHNSSRLLGHHLLPAQ